MKNKKTHAALEKNADVHNHPAMDTSTMACYESEALSFQHVSIERQIQETHQYPMEKSIQQFFRDSPELCLNICLALEEKVKLTVAIFQKAMDKADQCLTEKEAAIQRLTQLMAMIIREKDLRIADKEQMLQQVRKEKEERIEEKNAHLAEKEEHIQEKNAHIAEKIAHIAEKNELLQQVRKEKEEHTNEKKELLQLTRKEKEECIAEKNQLLQLTRKEKEECIAEKNQLLQLTRKEKEECIAEKNQLLQLTRKEKEECIAEKNQLLQQARNDQEARLEEKDRLIQEMRHCSETEKKLLTSMLERANTETLNLSQSLSVRGMIEKIEHQYSDKRRKGGPDVSRRAVWIEILQKNDALRRTLTRHCSDRNIEKKIDAVAATIAQIYRQVSDEIHHAGYHEIPIQKSKFHGIQLDLLRDLCAATHFAIREV
jgi:hypothetical protein